MRPALLPPRFDAIPQLLQEHPRWLVWGPDGEGKKTPRTAHKPERNCHPARPSNWSTFAKSTDSATKNALGVGFALGAVAGGPTFAGVDLDDCRDPQTGVLAPWAQRIVSHVDSYTEVSPSGTGVKVFVLGTLGAERQGKVHRVEIYDQQRYFTVTGHHLAGTPLTVEPREDRLRELHATVFSRDLVQLAKLFDFHIADRGEWVDIRCPWAEHHSGNDGKTDAALHRKDGNVDGFNCFHAGCQAKTVRDVWEFFGLRGGNALDFITDADDRIVARSQENIRRAIDMLSAKLEHDVFADKMYLVTPDGRRELDDPALARLYLTIEGTFHFSPPREYFDMVVEDAARTTPIHPVLNYLGTLQWDGVPRLDTWLSTYGGADDTELTRQISALTLIAAVRRVRAPGCKFDEMLVLESPQGMFKSTALATLCPEPEWFSDDFPLHATTKEVIERTLGIWIMEASELSGIHGGSRQEHLKGLMSRRKDGPVRLAYGRKPTYRYRHFIVIGTTNETTGYLEDTTGGRRFWPIAVQRFDIDALRRDRDQLWAEAASREARGDSIRLSETFWPLAGKEQEKRREEDPWESELESWLGPLEPYAKQRFTVDEVWPLLGIGAERRTPALLKRLNTVLRRIGCRPMTVQETPNGDGTRRGRQVRGWGRNGPNGLTL